MKSGDKVIIKETNTKAVICAVGTISHIPYYTLIVDKDLVREKGRCKFFTADDIKPYDALITFLDNNPNDTPELTESEKLAYYEEEAKNNHLHDYNDFNNI